MRVVEEAGDLASAIDGARHEALQAFGNERLILERYIPNARHIEFQILADAHSNVLHLFERECSVQRRHQKIIEESPSPFLDDRLREEMGQAAVTAARVVGYQNAGTIEFIIDPETQRYYFLEMNTRLQVEHAVSELVTGMDLVQAQFRIASGEQLAVTQKDLQSRGHAIECRLYAEDPANHFLPATGRLLRYVEPKGPGVRVDSGATSGDEITIYYDPLIAKLITWAEDRASAIRKMEAALSETILLGVTQNVQFLQDVLADPDFRAGNYNTTWVEKRFIDWQPPQCALPPEVLAAAALIQFQPDLVPGQETSVGPDPYSPWSASSGFRIGER
jgi:acetyl/propionyl-CoA carboxylase alpha subunit